VAISVGTLIQRVDFKIGAPRTDVLTKADAAHSLLLAALLFIEHRTNFARSRHGMHKRARSWGNWLTLAIFLSAVIGAALWIGRAEEKPSGRDELKIEVAELRSQAGVGQLLAEQAATGNVTSIFHREQASQLQKNVEAARKQLDPSEFEPGVRAAAERAGELSARLGEDVRALGDTYGDAPAAGALKDEFANLFSQLMSLENSLKS